jgi:hypothetical protein
VFSVQVSGQEEMAGFGVQVSGQRKDSGFSVQEGRPIRIWRGEP